MTRDEAIKIVVSGSGPYVCSDHMAGTLVDTWVAVGMLKLDEPKSAAEKFGDAFRAMPAENRKYLSNVLGCLEAAGLNIVEK
jgi:hypothetical protein